DGPEAFAKFMRTIKGGRRFDQALSDVYGFAKLDDFESAFKKAIGVTQQGSPTARPTAATTPTPRANATATPRPAGAAATGDDDSGIGTGTIVIGGVAVLFILGAILAFLISMVMANNRKGAAARQPGWPASAPSDPDDWKPPGGPPSGE
ncbi:MAG: hypothetical protein WBO97_05840, partial [Tepidiformaceae bacterium]